MTYGRPGVYVNERLLPASVVTEGTSQAAGALVGKFKQGPTQVKLVTSWYDFVRTYGGYDAAYPATFGVGMFFRNGGSELYVRRVVHNDAVKATALITSGDATVATVTALSDGAEGNNLRIQLLETGTAGYYNLTVYKEGTSADSATLVNDIILERYTNVVINDGATGDFIETVVNQNSNYISVAVDDVNKDLTPSLAIIPLSGGDNGTTPTAADYLGTDNAVIEEFSAIDRPLVLFAPEIIAELGDTDGATVQAGLVSWAEQHNCFVVLDTDQAMDGTNPNLTVDQAIDYASGFEASSFAAVYYPNIYISDPVGRSNSALRKIGPAGAVAGLYMQTDREIGPFKAPAGVAANIVGAVALEKSFTSAELDSLNSGVKSNGTAVATAVNALRNLPGAGIVVMGARTLKQDNTANKYVNMRRSLIYIKKELESITQFALFENNDPTLWSRLNTAIGSFLNAYRNQGGLRGNSPADAYYVKVDAENNPSSSIQLGEVHIEVGVALQYPAEFVVINLSQTTGE